ncbi:hypothetical protein QQS21_006687 [Conoideocrella luteorostrata]|uniref:DUF7582 domain-containing protein n=1 Tax=Conoideocrella luteorostrata TaxID=1105319 RepID=A0AAJ0CM38_9HYPO|nr:hypothetical protein QQS21_006687 [Conoideocrella luteorostrata]
MPLKEWISSPLEAGPSVLDGHHLPPQLTPALEHASSRLARKSIHLTLVVVRRDYQLPPAIPPQASPGSFCSPTTPASPPSRFSFATGPVTALKQLVRTTSRHGSDFSARSASSASTTSSVGLESPGLGLGLRLRWPLSPTTPLSPPPMTPCTPSSVATDYLGPMTPGVSGLRLFHAPDLPAKDQRIQRGVFTKTMQRFNLGNSLLSPAVDPTAYGLSSKLFTNSLVQNEVLFSSDGLTLLSIDRLYSVKSALSSYSKTRSPLRLEDAVDELRRYILANNGAKVTHADLLRSYDWLNISPAAVSDLDQMYRRAYGGPDEVGAISGVKRRPPSKTLNRHFGPHPEPTIRSDDDDGLLISFDEEEEEAASLTRIGLAVTTSEVNKPPTPRGPALKIQTSFDLVETPVLRSKWDHDDDDDDDDGGGGGGESNGNKEDTGRKDSDKDRDVEDVEEGQEEEDGDRTARPLETLPVGFAPWNGSSIDQVLSAVAGPERSSIPHGPTTPNGYDDISPITKGEWGFLMMDDAFRGARTVAVETC